MLPIVLVKLIFDGSIFQFVVAGGGHKFRARMFYFQTVDGRNRRAWRGQCDKGDPQNLESP